jgi:hypothetical protein
VKYVEKFQVSLNSERIAGPLNEAILNIQYHAEFFLEDEIFRSNL